MRKQFFVLTLLLVLVAATQAFAQTATVVTQSGQRLRGQIVSMGGYDNSGYGNEGYGGYNTSGDSITVRVNGRNQQIPIGDVAVVDFTGSGNVSRAEMDRARSSDGMVVLRNGQTIAGRPVDLQSYNNQLLVAGQYGDRSVPLSQVARIYFGANGNGFGNQADNGYRPYSGPTNGVYGQYGNNDPYYGSPSYGTNRTVTIPTNQTWTNSGIDVRRGEIIHFRASGNVTLSENPNDNGTPAGANDGRLAGNSPLPGVTGGMLIGRVGNSAPFAIGAESDVPMPSNGRLYLGVNDDYVGDNRGSFVVEMFPR